MLFRNLFYVLSLGVALTPTKAQSLGGNGKRILYQNRGGYQQGCLTLNSDGTCEGNVTPVDLNDGEGLKCWVGGVARRVCGGGHHGGYNGGYDSGYNGGYDNNYYGDNDNDYYYGNAANEGINAANVGINAANEGINAANRGINAANVGINAGINAANRGINAANVGINAGINAAHVGQRYAYNEYGY